MQVDRATQVRIFQGSSSILTKILKDLVKNIIFKDLKQVLKSYNSCKILKDPVKFFSRTTGSHIVINQQRGIHCTIITGYC